MNTTKRFLLGFLSTALFAAGFSHAANALDPLTRKLPGVSETVSGTTPDTIQNCFFTSNAR